jgi:hypothetical protein
MLREIINGLKGRKKIVDEPIDYSKVWGFLWNLKDSVRGNIAPRLSPGFIEANKYDLSPEMLRYYLSDLLDSYSFYTANHQVYEGENGEKRHYFDIVSEREKLPRERVTIDIILASDDTLPAR